MKHIELTDEKGNNTPFGDEEYNSGNPYYDRDYPNLQVDNQISSQYGLSTKREVMDFYLQQMPREKFISSKPRIISMPEI